MFLRFFRSSFATQYIVIGLTGLILWARAMFEPSAMPAPTGPVPLYRLLYFLIGAYPALCVVSGFILAVICAFLLNHLLDENDLIVKNTSLTAFIFMILISYFPLFLILNPVLISLFFLLLILNRLNQSYGRIEPLDLFFATGFLGSVGSFFYTPFIFISIYLVFALVILRSASWREYMSVAIGIITPFIFLSVYYYWFDILEAKALDFVYSLHIQFIPAFKGSVFYIVLSFVVILFLLVAWSSYIYHPPERTIEVRRKSLLLFWTIGLAVISSSFDPGLLNFHFELLFIPASWLIAYYLLHKKGRLWKEVVFLLLLVTILLNNLLFFYW